MSSSVRISDPHLMHASVSLQCRPVTAGPADRRSIHRASIASRGKIYFKTRVDLCLLECRLVQLLFERCAANVEARVDLRRLLDAESCGRQLGVVRALDLCRHPGGDPAPCQQPHLVRSAKIPRLQKSHVFHVAGKPLVQLL